jgi:hypothetical protein
MLESCICKPFLKSKGWRRLRTRIHPTYPRITSFAWWDPSLAGPTIPEMPKAPQRACGMLHQRFHQLFLLFVLLLDINGCQEFSHHLPPSCTSTIQAAAACEQGGLVYGVRYGLPVSTTGPVGLEYFSLLLAEFADSLGNEVTFVTFVSLPSNFQDEIQNSIPRGLKSLGANG